MKNSTRSTRHKLGANSNEFAKKAKRHDNNFSQSRDIHEDRGQRQNKNTPRPQLLAGATRGR
jgi:hypothetical protein